jgi:type III restriction enzyme
MAYLHEIFNNPFVRKILSQIRKESRTIEIDTDKFWITGVPFYNNENENECKETLEKTLN